MSHTTRDYDRRLLVGAEAPAREVEVASALDRLHAFNFGRAVGRMEVTHDHFWFRLRWILVGCGVGVTLTSLYLHVSGGGHLVQFVR